MSMKKALSSRKPFQQISFQNIYESRICSPVSRVISSYPLCSSASKRTSSILMSSRRLILNGQNQVNRKANQQEQPQSPLKQKSRPKSLDFKNNLFQRLASKMQKQRHIQNKKNSQVLNEYYENANDKENHRRGNTINQRQLKPMPIIKRLNNASSSNHLTQSRHQKCQEATTTQKSHIKFNKIKSKLTQSKKPNDQMDIVRTSDADFKAAKESLDMCPIYL